MKPDFSVYYKDAYWNDFSKVIDYMSENFSGDKSVYWVQHFKEKYAQKKFKRALSFNCGNGWVERDFIDKNIVEKIIAFDISNDLLRIANKEKQNREIEYFQADVNQIDFPANQFDLIINVAALHHIQYIDRFMRILCKSLKPDGLFVNFDYIGPHRNQYPLSQWQLIKKINQSLPANARRSPLIYPHLPTMLSVDPTEAIHSELIMNTTKHYFTILERHDTGGGIAYEILSHNQNLLKLDKNSQDEVLNYVINKDRDLTRKRKVPALFSYFVARPEKLILENYPVLRMLEKKEIQREKKSLKSSGSYYFFDTIKMILHRWYINLIHRYPKMKPFLKNLANVL